ncbi:MAG: DNA-processing protein DprA [Armatimonadetes bacterium]|nr:DNA-processing protein DprA [Armatimonadota bacterium]
MSITRRKLTLALAECPGIGAKTITRIHTRNDLLGRKIDEFLRLGVESLHEEYKIKPQTATKWVTHRDEWMAQADELEAKLAPFQIHVVTAADAHYPRIIESLDPDPPGVLYLFGNTRLLQSETFAVLASRNPDEDALRTIEACTEEHIFNGRSLVSGHDTPTYQRSAVTALRYGAPRTMVFDTGLFDALGDTLRNEPFAAARLWRYEFDRQTDLAVTFINPIKSYHRNSNRMRDRIVAGLAKNIDFISISPGGNMEKIAQLSLKSTRRIRVHESVPIAEKLESLGASILAAR